MDIMKSILKVRQGVNVGTNMELLWNQYEGLIKKMCRKYAGVAEFDDLYQEGYIALNRAVLGYDQTNGANFTTYFYQVLKHTLHVYVNKQNIVTTPSNLSMKAGRLSVFIRDYNSLYGRNPSESEKRTFLRVMLKTEPQALERVEKALEAKTVKSIDEPVTEDGHSLCEILPDDSCNMYDDVIREYDRNVLCDDMKEALQKLNDRQLDIVKKVYYEDKNLTEVGEILGISRERARQILSTGFRKIRNTDYKKKLWNYFEVYLSAAPCRHVGLSQFNRTWTSEQEYQVLREERYREKVEKTRREHEELRERIRKQREQERLEEIRMHESLREIHEEVRKIKETLKEA